MGPRRLKQFFDLRFKEIAGANSKERDGVERRQRSAPGRRAAFYTLLSLAPLLVVIVGVAALAFGRKSAGGHLAWQIQGLMNRDVAEAIQALIQEAYKPGTGVIAACLAS